ncbi:hypothetical protein [Chondrinema litorale]|uniref:hypothetical protein n=1 Tax=Chondrinema litorale TaxID=2994555 RepID=UPI00254399A2|nr:hypothetical protein [Chondrinema litorale]UZR95434.1 hypothetical protein OQ292_06355 [Chondrinema litorale]
MSTNHNNEYIEWVDQFHSRLEQLALEKELIFSRILSTQLHLTEIRNVLQKENQNSLERLSRSHKALQNHTIIEIEPKF